MELEQGPSKAVVVGSNPITSTYMRAYPSGEGIRLISVNARGSIPLARTKHESVD